MLRAVRTLTMWPIGSCMSIDTHQPNRLPVHNARSDFSTNMDWKNTKKFMLSNNSSAISVVRLCVQRHRTANIWVSQLVYFIYETRYWTGIVETFSLQEGIKRPKYIRAKCVPNKSNHLYTIWGCTCIRTLDSNVSIWDEVKQTSKLMSFEQFINYFFLSFCLSIWFSSI